MESSRHGRIFESIYDIDYSAPARKSGLFQTIAEGSRPIDYAGVMTGAAAYPCGCPIGGASLYSACPKHGPLSVMTAANAKGAIGSVSLLANTRPAIDYAQPITSSASVATPAPPLDLATKKDVQALAAMVKTLIERQRPTTPKRPRPKGKRQASKDEGERWVLEELLAENDSLRAEKAQLQLERDEQATEIRLLKLNAQLGWGTEPYPDLGMGDFDQN